MYSNWFGRTLVAFVVSTGFLMPLTEAQQPVRNPDTLVVVTREAFSLLDPHLNTDIGTGEVLAQIYGKLLQYAGASTEVLLPEIAKRIPTLHNGGISEDGLSYTFETREGLFFSSGDPLTVEDIEYSFERWFVLGSPSSGFLLNFLFEENVSSIYGPDGLPLESIDGKPLSKAIDDVFTVNGNLFSIHLAKPFSPLPQMMASFGYVINKSFVADLGGWPGFTGDTSIDMANISQYTSPTADESVLFSAADGSGAFTLVNWNRGEGAILLARNDNFNPPSAEWAAFFDRIGPAVLKNILFRSVPDLAGQELALQQGAVDIVRLVDPSRLSILAATPGLRVIDVPINLAFALHFNFEIQGTEDGTALGVGSGKLDGHGIPGDFFQDKDVREGFAKAFDAAAFIHDSQLGRGVLPASPLISTLPFHNPAQEGVRFNLEEAAAAFQRAFNGELWEKGFELSCFNYSPPSHTACAMIKQSVEAIHPGKFTIELREFSGVGQLIAEALTHRVAFYAVGWQANIPDPHGLIGEWMTTTGPYGAVVSIDSLPAWGAGGAVPLAGDETFEYANWDELLAAAFASTDPSFRQALYYEAQRQFVDNVTAIMIITPVIPSVQRTWVNNWYDNPSAPPLLYAVDKRVNGLPNCKTLKQLPGITVSDGAC